MLVVRCAKVFRAGRWKVALWKESAGVVEVFGTEQGRNKSDIVTNFFALHQHTNGQQEERRNRGSFRIFKRTSRLLLLCCASVERALIEREGAATHAAARTASRSRSNNHRRLSDETNKTCLPLRGTRENALHCCCCGARARSSIDLVCRGAELRERHSKRQLALVSCCATFSRCQRVAVFQQPPSDNR